MAVSFGFSICPSFDEEDESLGFGEAVRAGAILSCTGEEAPALPVEGRGDAAVALGGEFTLGKGFVELEGPFEAGAGAGVGFDTFSGAEETPRLDARSPENASSNEMAAAGSELAFVGSEALVSASIRRAAFSETALPFPFNPEAVKMSSKFTAGAGAAGS